MHSIFNTFSRSSGNIGAIRLAETVESITNDLLKQDREEIFELYNSDNSRLAIKNLIIKYISSNRHGLGQNSEVIMNLVLEKIYDYYPVQHLIDDEDVTDIIISAVDDVVYKKRGKLYKAREIVFPSVDSLEQFVRKCVWKNGGELTVQKPYYLGSDLERKIRISASLPPFSIQYPNIHLRIHRPYNSRLADMQSTHHMMDLQVLKLLQSCVKEGLRFLVVGPPGSGKTTLSRAIINEISHSIPSVTVEECPEWYVEKPNNRAFTILQRYNKSDREMTYDMSTLSGIVRYLLVAGTTCISIGEIKGAEAFDILHAYMTGNFGVNTLHVDDIMETHTRFAFMAAANPHARNYNTEKLEEMFSKSFDLIIFMDQFRVKDICQIYYDGETVRYNHLFKYVEGKDSAFYMRINEMTAGSGAMPAKRSIV